MATSESLRAARRVVPITALVVALTTLFSCVAIAKLRKAFLSGLYWPFFSDTGRDKPAYYVFCAGLTTTAILLVATYTFNYQYQIAVLRKAARTGFHTRRHQRMTVATHFAGCISVFGLSLLAFFDTASYPKTHQITAYWFFCWEVVATVNNTFVSKKIYDLASKLETPYVSNYVILEEGGKTNVDERADRTRKRGRTFRLQRALNCIFFVAFMVYIPWQLVFPTHCPLLTVSDCIDRGLGDHYCSVTMRKNATETILANCEDHLLKVQTRAFGQLVSILTLIGYCVTFVAHDYDDAERDDAQPLHPL